MCLSGYDGFSMQGLIERGALSLISFGSVLLWNHHVGKFADISDLLRQLGAWKYALLTSMWSKRVDALQWVAADDWNHLPVSDAESLQCSSRADPL